jgi:predicted alpha/beta-hydrolase family hydrolase
MSIANGQVDTPAGAVSCAVDHTPGVPLFVMAHGAGGSLADRATASAARTLGSAGLGTLRFNFPYRERKSGRPDPMPVLTATFAAVVEAARQQLKPGALIIGGRSMGGRAASMLAAEGFECDGLLLLAYPLHPPGQLTKLRDAHIPAIRVPVLCFNGTRDTFCDRTLMERAVTTATTDWTMHWLEGADHSFHVLKSSGRTDADVLAEVRDATAAWMRAHHFVA